MENKLEIHINLIGDVFAKYTISAQPLAMDKKICCTLETLDTNTPEVKQMFDDGLVLFPMGGGHIYGPDERPRKKATPPYYFPNGMLTKDGVIATVSHVVSALEEIADRIWENIDPRCGAKIPSRLYRNVAYVCADVLSRVGIPAKVTKLTLDPEKHNGLRNQYRVVVNAKVPDYPWMRERVVDPENPRRVHYNITKVWGYLNFDFDVTNALRVCWVWSGSDRILGHDARVLKDGKPVRWVGSISKVGTRTPVPVTIRYSSTNLVPSAADPDVMIRPYSDAELLCAQTSILSVLREITDGTDDSMSVAMREMIGSEGDLVNRRSALTRMAL